jgi:transposase
MKPLKSWAKAGTTPAIVGCSQPGVNCSLCMSIDRVSGLRYRMITGSYNTASFSEFVKDIVKILSEEKVTDSVLIMDNARIHNEEAILERCKGVCELKFLSPYSPMFNPIENVFGTIKSKVRRIMGTPEYTAKAAAGFL